MEQEVQILLEDIALEARYENCGGKKGAVIAHPHPLYGGNMHNNVVLTIKEAFLEKGISTLRFNFRGVGNSQGFFGEGIEEQKDIYGAIKFLEEKGHNLIYLAGYSFGARVIVSCKFNEIVPAAFVLVSLPVAFMPVDKIDLPDVPILVITGELDDIAPYDKLKDLFKGHKNSKLLPIKGADHFYWGKEQGLYQTLIQNLP